MLKSLDIFFSKNWTNISLVVLGLFLILAVISVKNINFNPDMSVDRVILFEKFKGKEGFREGQIMASHQASSSGSDQLSHLISMGSQKSAPDQLQFCQKNPMDLDNSCKKIHRKNM